MMAFAVTTAVTDAMKLAKKLSSSIVEGSKPEAQPYRVWDTTVPQLFLRVMPSGVKSWNVAWHRQGSKSLGKWPGVTIEAARTQARKLLTTVADHGAPPAEVKDTVADACRNYVGALRAEGRKTAADDAERRFERAVYADAVGKIKLSKLTQDDLEAWRGRVECGELPELPTKKGRPPKAKPISRASFNRMRTPLVAALNRAVSRRKVHPDRAIEWESVKPYDVEEEATGDIYLDRDQRRALLASANGDVRDLIECVIWTGCRAGDPAAVLRRDYDARHGTVRFSTKDHPRTIPVSPEAKALFDRLAKDKLPAAHLFTNDGKPWKKNWHALVKAAVQDAGLPERATLKSLRHCWITDSIVGGMDLLTVAKQAGTSLAMIDKTYGHLVQGAARAKLAEIKFL